MSITSIKELLANAKREAFVESASATEELHLLSLRCSELSTLTGVLPGGVTEEFRQLAQAIDSALERITAINGRV